MSALSSLAAMVVEPMMVDDAPAIVRIAHAWGHQFMGSLDAVGFVVHDGADAVCYATARETGHGVVVDDLWPERSKRGRIALGVMADFLEAHVQRLADERGKPVTLGGIVLEKNLAHDLALDRRGYKIAGNIRVKEFAPHGRS